MLGGGEKQLRNEESKLITIITRACSCTSSSAKTEKTMKKYSQQFISVKVESKTRFKNIGILSDISFDLNFTVHIFGT